MESSKQHSCTFILEPPKGSHSKGVCSICGKEKQFANSPEDTSRYSKKMRWNAQHYKKQEN